MPDPQAIPKIPQRPFDRDGKTISAIVWELNRAPRDADRELVAASRALGADWFLFFSTLAIGALGQWRTLLDETDHLIVGVDSDELVARRNRVLVDRLESLGRTACDAVMLQDVDTDSLKAGRPFHRLSQLREAGLANSIVLDASNAEVAEWMTENTPAHAVAVPYDLSDQTAHYRLFDVAQEMGTKLLSRRASVAKIQIAATSDEAIAFRFSDPNVTAMIEPFPMTVAQVHQIANASTIAIPSDQRDGWWRTFQEKVPPPPKPKRGHPPEYGS